MNKYIKYYITTFCESNITKTDRNWIQRNHWNTSLKCYFYKLSWRLGAQSRSHIYQTTSTTIHHLRPRNFLYLLECAYVCTSYGEIYYLRKYSLLWDVGSILNQKVMRHTRAYHQSKVNLFHFHLSENARNTTKFISLLYPIKHTIQQIFRALPCII